MCSSTAWANQYDTKQRMTSGGDALADNDVNRLELPYTGAKFCEHRHARARRPGPTQVPNIDVAQCAERTFGKRGIRRRLRRRPEPIWRLPERSDVNMRHDRGMQGWTVTRSVATVLSIANAPLMACWVRMLCRSVRSDITNRP